MLPQSDREVFALVCLGQLLWLGAMATLAGVSSWSAATLMLLGVGGACAILAAGLIGARRFRR